MFNSIDNENKKQITNIINEELSIANEVASKAREVSSRIIDELKNAEPADSDIPGAKKWNAAFDCEFKGCAISVSVIYYNFINKEALENANGKYDYLFSSSSKISHNLWTVVVKCYGVSGGLVKEDLYDSVQHEFEHIFQGEMGDSSLTDVNLNYMIVAANLSNPKEQIRKIAEVLYPSFNNEQDAMANGLYAVLMKRKAPIPCWSDIKDSEIYAWLLKIRSGLEYIDSHYDNKELYKDCREVFGISLDKVLKVGEDSERRILTKIGKILIKVRKDKMTEGVVYRLGSKGKPQPYFEDYRLSELLM